MALILVKETGAGLANANTYADVADCDAYHEARLYSTTWTQAGDSDKAKALAMASRTIDSAMEFRGYLKSTAQALQWPRVQAERDGVGEAFGTVGMGQRIGPWWADDVVPPILVTATCEMARLLLDKDRTADDGAKGIQSVGLGQKAIEVVFNAADRALVLSDEILRMLAVLGVRRGGSMMRTVKRA